MDVVDIIPRQIWADPTPTSSSVPRTCTPFRLPSGGIINIGQGTVTTLTEDAAFQPPCSITPLPPPVDPSGPNFNLAVIDAQEPWYASTLPQIYAISAVTIVSYMLVIMLFITPRTFFVGGAGGGAGFLGQAGTMNGAYGNNSIVGVGGRPWLQKIAALLVAISMTMVTANTFTWAHRQYDAGYQDAREITAKVIGGLEISIVRVISETFLWLAQAQTLIRLFPRHREKLLIKWLAFALIVLELIFSCLHHFWSKPNHSQRFVSAIPAMNYLFALTLNLCYGGFIVYYALQKRRFAFYHSHMRNMPLVALLSLTAVLIPVVFFVIDLSSPDISGWGSYVRWVGSAAASVVVWEWVERIEALERDEKKNGILGREIFDGDEMLDVKGGSNASWSSSQSKYGKNAGPDSGASLGVSTGWSGVVLKARRLGSSRHLHALNLGSRTKGSDSSTQGQTSFGKSEEGFVIGHGAHPTVPSPVASPFRRTDSASSGNAIYIFRNDHGGEATQTNREADLTRPRSQQRPDQRMSTLVEEPREYETTTPVTTSTKRQALSRILYSIPIPFRGQRETPPPEVVRALAERPQEVPDSQDQNTQPHNSILQRFHVRKNANANGPPGPVIIIPAPPRKRDPWNEDFVVAAEENPDGDEQRSVRHSRMSSEDGFTNQNDDDDTPPEAVLNAMSASNSPTRWSNHAP